MDDDLRRRYRRDYSRESIRSDPPKNPKPIARPAAERPTALRKQISEVEKDVPTPDLPIPQVDITKTASRKHKVRHKRSRLKVILSIIVLLIGCAVAGALAYTKLSGDTPQVARHFPSSITKSQTKMQLYYPTNLPGGYVVNNDFKTPEANVVTYSVSDSKSNKYVIAIQPLPRGFNIDDQKTKLLNPDTIKTNYGSAIVGTTVDGLLALIRTDDNSLIIIHALNKDTQPQLETIIKALQKSN
jgi:hypothetical protein